MLNQVILIGQLTHKPELEEDEFGKLSTSFQLAVERNWTNSRGEREVDNFTIIAWAQIAKNIVEYLSEGSMVAIEGNLNIDNYSDEDGNSRKMARIKANDVRFLPGQGKKPQRERKPNSPEDELPF